jgi:hypothetical protein
LQEQLGVEDNPAYIRTFQAQIRVLLTAQVEPFDKTGKKCEKTDSADTQAVRARFRRLQASRQVLAGAG